MSLFVNDISKEAERSALSSIEKGELVQQWA
jgi:hypothetical protein